MLANELRLRAVSGVEEKFLFRLLLMDAGLPRKVLGVSWLPISKVCDVVDLKNAETI